MIKYAIGIDGGGTSCRAAVADAAGAILGRGKAGAANILTDLQGSLDNIVASARAAVADAGLAASALDDSAAVLGVAGANVGPYGRRVQAALPFDRSHVVTDSLIALQGALGDDDGVVGAFGTGSVYGARRDGMVTEIGGWGFVIGDQASGARLGRDLLEQTLLAHDGVRPATPLTRLIMERFAGDPQQIVEFAHQARPKDFAAYSPLVFAHATNSDGIAKAIVESAASDIDESLDALVWPECPRICLLGGLAEAYRPWLAQAHQALIADPKGDALQGAISLAVELAFEGERRSA
jgi:glucosamine kinase